MFSSKLMTMSRVAMQSGGWRGILGRATMPSTDNHLLRIVCRVVRRGFSTEDWSIYYKIEANNATRSDMTQLTVTGPDVDGILANMTVALAMKGCSLVELHAGKNVDTAMHHHQFKEEEVPMIHDVFFVVDRSTGAPFSDEDLEPLAASLLASLKTPMNLVGIGGKQPKLPPTASPSSHEEKIKIIKSTDRTIGE